MNASRVWVSVCVLAGLLAGTANAVNIATVPVGDRGNAADTRYNSVAVGTVAYTYNVGTYEVSAGQYTEFLNAVAKTDTYGLYNTYMWNDTSGCKIRQTGGSGNYSYLVDANGDGVEDTDWVNRPVNYVSWGDSARFANWMHNGQPSGAQDASTTEDGSYYLNGATSDAALLAVTRKANATWVIPSEDEWYKAAYYKGGSTNAGYFDYPTRSDTAPGRDMADVSRNNANYYAGSGPFPIDSPCYTTVVGEFQNSRSPYGTFDQGGNVWEWHEAVLYGSYRGVRGGSFNRDDGSLHAAWRAILYPAAEEFGIGFRVCEVPEPATAGVFLLGGLLVARRRRGRR